MTPIFSELASDFNGQIRFFKLNVRADLANQKTEANFGVLSTLTLLFLCKGRPVGQIVGLMPKDDLEKGLSDMLVRHQTCIDQSTELRPAYVV